MSGLGGLSEETRAWVEAKVIEFVGDMYAQYRERKAAGLRASEPSITASLLIDYVRQYSMPRDLDMMLSRRDLRSSHGRLRSQDPQKLAIYGIIERLRKKEILVGSTGVGDGGREARMYEPGPNFPGSTGGLADGEVDEAIQRSTGGWVKVRDRDAAAAMIWPMFVNAYKTIGLVHADPSEFREYDGEWLVHSSPGKMGFDAFQLTKRTRYGRKMGLGGSDGSPAAKAALKDFFVSFCLVNGAYGEVSHAVEAVVKKANVPAVCAVHVQPVLGGKVVRAESDGLHYTRTITGVGPVTKVMVGRPYGIPTTPILTPSCPVGQPLSSITHREVMMEDDEKAARAAHAMMMAIL